MPAPQTPLGAAVLRAALYALLLIGFIAIVSRCAVLSLDLNYRSPPPVAVAPGLPATPESPRTRGHGDRQYVYSSGVTDAMHGIPGAAYSGTWRYWPTNAARHFTVPMKDDGAEPSRNLTGSSLVGQHPVAQEDEEASPEGVSPLPANASRSCRSPRCVLWLPRRYFPVTSSGEHQPRNSSGTASDSTSSDADYWHTPEWPMGPHDERYRPVASFSAVAGTMMAFPKVVFSVSSETTVSVTCWVQEGESAGAEMHLLHFVGTPLSDSRIVRAFGVSGNGKFHLRSVIRKNESDAVALATKFTYDSLNGTEATTLFGFLLQKNGEREARRRKVNSASPGVLIDGAANASSTVHIDSPRQSVAIFHSSCFWLADFYRETTDELRAEMYSTCGDRVSATALVGAYTRLTHNFNFLAVGAIVFPFTLLFAGIVDLQQWVSNSRGRTLRMSRIQMLMLAVWASLFAYFISRLRDWYPLTSKPQTVLFVLQMACEMHLAYFYFLIERAEGQGTGQDPLADSRVRIFLTIFLTMTLATLVLAVLRDAVTDPKFIFVITVVFWLPQFYRNFVAEGGSGLTVRFTAATSFLAIVPLTVLGGFSDQIDGNLDARQRTGLLVGAAIVVVETVVMCALRLLGNRRILPPWLAPWRHHYATTFASHTTELAEDSECSICRSSLKESEERDEQLWMTPCRHLFHASCLAQWMQERMECPLCRAVLPEP